MKLIQLIRQTMNWDSVEELIGSAMENWSKLTDQDLERYPAKESRWSARIQETYGITRREADKHVWGWGKSVEGTRKTIA